MDEENPESKWDSPTGVERYFIRGQNTKQVRLKEGYLCMMRPKLLKTCVKTPYFSALCLFLRISYFYNNNKTNNNECFKDEGVTRGFNPRKVRRKPLRTQLCLFILRNTHCIVDCKSVPFSFSFFLMHPTKSFLLVVY